MPSGDTPSGELRKDVSAAVGSRARSGEDPWKLREADPPNARHFYVEGRQMNSERRQQIEAKYPNILEDIEVAAGTGGRIWTAYYVLLIVALQMTIAAALHFYEANLWVVMPVAWLVGAVAIHAMWVLIHDLTHMAVFESTNWSLIYHVIANFPIIFPATISFKYYHQLHHSHLNEAYGDPDLPGPLENRIFGSSALGKAVWLLFFFLLQPFRTIRYRPNFGGLGKWIAVNWIVQLAVNVAVWYFTGWRGLVYLTASSAFAIGLHPLGARWVAEHYSIKPPQETYSYYGSFNYLMFNIGYHNEHHDFPSVPWYNLPKLKAAAPDFYDNLWYHTSYWRLLYDFIVNPGFTLHSRVVRRTKGSDFLYLQSDSEENRASAARDAKGKVE